LETLYTIRQLDVSPRLGKRSPVTEKLVKCCRLFA
jgi:hypothetical protein